jgi:hypothetical protein
VQPKSYSRDCDALQEAYTLSKLTGQCIYRHEVYNKFGNRRWLISEISDQVVAEIDFFLHEELTRTQ